MSMMQAGTPRSFNPRTPCGVRLANLPHVRLHYRFQSTHSLRSATRAFVLSKSEFAVSIHALLAECDRTSLQASHQQISFNPRTPCGVRQINFAVFRKFYWFQSTHSLRSATLYSFFAYFVITFQSTHSLRSATSPRKWTAPPKMVSIHALLAECDN